jgi:hypothetical protein
MPTKATTAPTAIAMPVIVNVERTRRRNTFFRTKLENRIEYPRSLC